MFCKNGGKKILEFFVSHITTVYYNYTTKITKWAKTVIDLGMTSVNQVRCAFLI